MRLKETFSSFVQKFVQYYKDHKKRTIAIGSGILLVATLLVAILGGSLYQAEISQRRSISWEMLKQCLRLLLHGAQAALLGKFTIVLAIR